jgi:putative peptidoglycan lipid II flippase
MVTENITSRGHTLLNAFRSPRTVNHQIFRAASTVALLSAGVKVIATVKELAVARSFGRGDALDAFLIAYMLPAFVVTLVAITLNSALVPTFIQVRTDQGDAAAQRLFSSAMLWSQGLLLTVTIALAAAGPFILRHIASGFPPAKLALTLHLFYALLPLILLSGVASNCGSVLNACGRFAIPALMPLTTPALTLLLLLTRVHQWNISVLVVGALLGAAIEVVCIAWALRHRGFHLEFRWYGLSAELRQVGTQYLPLLVAGLLSSGVGIVDQSMAAMLEPGSVAALSYGNRIVSVIVGLTSASLCTAVIPYLSQMVATQDWTGCRRTLQTYTRVVSFALIPVAIVLVLGSSTIVRLLYQRGAFTIADTVLVSRVQAMYALQLLFCGVGMLYGRLLVAMKRNDLIMVGAALNLTLDVVLNIICMRYFGVAGIALSTSLFYFGSFLFCRTMANRLLSQKETLGLAAVVLREQAI